MKLEPIFYVKNSSLYKISDDSQVDLSSLQKIHVKWSEIEIDSDTYNEEFLAKLRDDLKKLESMEKFAFIETEADKPLQNESDEEAFTAAFNHCARRIKDCVSVVGMNLESKLKNPESFMETLAVKHAQYVYFSQDKTLKDNIVKY